MVTANTGLWVAMATGALVKQRSVSSRWSSPRFLLAMKKVHQEDTSGIIFIASVGQPSSAECVDWLLRSAL